MFLTSSLAEKGFKLNNDWEQWRVTDYRYCRSVLLSSLRGEHDRLSSVRIWENENAYQHIESWTSSIVKSKSSAFCEEKGVNFSRFHGRERWDIWAKAYDKHLEGNENTIKTHCQRLWIPYDNKRRVRQWSQTVASDWIANLLLISRASRRSHQSLPIPCQI